jgi:hypothetical protein
MNAAPRGSGMSTGVSETLTCNYQRCYLVVTIEQTQG